MTYNELAGEKIRLLRKTHNLSQHELGARISVSNVTISTWETGKKAIPEAKLDKIAQLFRLPMDWFFNDSKVDVFNREIKRESSFAFEDGMSSEEDAAEPEGFNAQLHSTMGSRIQFLRKQSQMTREDFAKKIGVKSRTVYNWEHDESSIKTIKLIQISKLFNVSLNWLKDGVDSKNDIYNNQDMDVHKEFSTKYSADGKRLIALFTKLSVYRRGKLFGYLDALCREEWLSEKDSIE